MHTVLEIIRPFQFAAAPQLTPFHCLNLFTTFLWFDRTLSQTFTSKEIGPSNVNTIDEDNV